jgi:hypothetical protein
MMLIDNKFNIGDIVYLATDAEQLPRIVTAITIRHNGFCEYELSQSSYTPSWHISDEITAEKNVLKTL